MANIKPIDFDSSNPNIRKIPQVKRNVSQTIRPAFQKKKVVPQEKAWASWAIVAFIVALIPGFQFLGLIFGFIALSKIKKDPNLKGKWFAIIAIILGFLQIIAFIIFFGIIIFYF